MAKKWTMRPKDRHNIPIVDVGHGPDSDRTFFQRWPGRRRRIRRTYPAERNLAQTSPPPGRAYFMYVEQLAPGARIRLCVTLPADLDTDIGDAAIKQLLKLKT
jgi:hypothetical protein